MFRDQQSYWKVTSLCRKNAGFLLTIANKRKLYTELISSPKLSGCYQIQGPALSLGSYIPKISLAFAGVFGYLVSPVWTTEMWLFSNKGVYLFKLFLIACNFFLHIEICLGLKGLEILYLKSNLLMLVSLAINNKPYITISKSSLLGHTMTFILRF